MFFSFTEDPEAKGPREFCDPNNRLNAPLLNTSGNQIATNYNMDQSQIAGNY